MTDNGASTILVKAYQPGTITAHQEQANLHARKKSSGRRQIAAGTTAAGLGVAAQGALQVNRHKVMRPINDAAMEGRISPKTAVRAAKAVNHAPVAVVAGGLGLAGAGAARSAFHGSRQNREARAAQAARKQRNTELAKADRRDATAAGLAGGSGAAAFSAERQRRRAKGQRTTAASLHEQSSDHYRVAENRAMRHAMPPGAKGHLPRVDSNIAGTAREMFLGRATQHRSAAMARNAFDSGRKAKGRAGAAVLLAGGAAAAAHRRDRAPRYTQVGYR